MVKVAFAILNLEVTKLYEKKFDSSDIDGINKHCEYIAEFIRAAGWTEEEFVRAMFNFDDVNVN